MVATSQEDLSHLFNDTLQISDADIMALDTKLGLQYMYNFTCIDCNAVTAQKYKDDITLAHGMARSIKRNFPRKRCHTLSVNQFFSMVKHC